MEKRGDEKMSSHECDQYYYCDPNPDSDAERDSCVITECPYWRLKTRTEELESDKTALEETITNLITVNGDALARLERVKALPEKWRTGSYFSGAFYADKLEEALK
jgi:hypothetical protein